MKIIIDLRVYDWTGIGRIAKGYIKHLPESMPESSFVFILCPGQATNTNFPNVVKEIIPYKTFDFREHYAIWKIIKKHRDAVIFHSLHFNTPLYLSNDIKLVTNIYDLAYEYTDDAFRSIFHKFYYKYFFPKTLRKSATIISQSDFTKSDLIKYYNHANSVVIYPGFEPGEWSCKSSLEKNNVLKDNYILFVGINHPRKNLKLLIEVFSEIVNENPFIHTKLFIVGGNSEDKRYNIPYDISKKRMDKRIKLFGYVSDNELINFYENAYIYIIPSLIESGYSYPALEAASFGIPVMANIYDMKEFGGDSLWYFNASDKNNFKDQLLKLLIDKKLRDDYSKRSLQWCKLYPWQYYMEKLKHVYLSLYK